MGNKITGKEYQLSKIFSKEFNYYIPAYQRPYAWTEEETETLFDDLLDFYQTEEVDNYFLGSIVLIKDEDKPKADVIDGQQRLTTLTILIAVIASYLTGENQSNCKNILENREIIWKTWLLFQDFICVKKIRSFSINIFKMSICLI